MLIYATLIILNHLFKDFFLLICTIRQCVQIINKDISPSFNLVFSFSYNFNEICFYMTLFFFVSSIDIN